MEDMTFEMEDMTFKKERITLLLEDLRERKDSPQPVSIKDLIIMPEEIRAAVMEEFPEAVIIEDGWMQWIAATPAAKRKLIQQLLGRTRRLEQELAGIRENIVKLLERS